MSEEKTKAFIDDLAKLFEKHGLYIPIDHDCIWPIERPILIQVLDGNQLFINDCDGWDIPDIVLAHTVYPKEGGA